MLSLSLSLSLSLRFNGHFPGESGLAGVCWSKGWWRWWWWQLDYWSLSRAKLQTNHHHHQTSIQFFLQAGCPSILSPNQQCQSTEGKKYHITWTCLPQSHLASSNLSLTTNSSWLPWGRVVMPLISPLMPVPRTTYMLYPLNDYTHCKLCCLKFFFVSDNYAYWN